MQHFTAAALLMLIHGHFTQSSRAFFPFAFRAEAPALCLFSAESLGGLSLHLVSDSSPCLQERRELRQESLRRLYDLVTLVDRLKVTENI